MLIVFPVGLLIFSLICDFISLRSLGDGRAVHDGRRLHRRALVAAVPGLVDFLSLADPHVKKIAIIHMSLNLLAVVLFAINICQRLHGSGNTGPPLLLSIVVIVILAISGWLACGKTVHIYGVGVAVPPGDRVGR